MALLFSSEDEQFMRAALALAQKGFGTTSPNPMVGAVLVRDGVVLGEGWHRRAGEAHAEINALASARRRGFDPRGATIFVTLEPCSTSGRTPPCTAALHASGLARVVVGATDPNPRHAGQGYGVLRKHRIAVQHGLLAEECTRLNEAFNHWIVTGQPLVTLKCALSLDGKIATNAGESKWITGERARAYGMRLRVGSDAILCGINTILHDDPSLMFRAVRGVKVPTEKRYQRIILDRDARTPLKAKVVSDEEAGRTIVVVGARAGVEKIRKLEKRVRVLRVPLRGDRKTFKLEALLETLGAEKITSLLVEGGGETHASFLAHRLAHRIHFFYAPLIISGRNAPKAVGGPATFHGGKGFKVAKPEWQLMGRDLLLTGLVQY